MSLNLELAWGRKKGGNGAVCFPENRFGFFPVGNALGFEIRTEIVSEFMGFFTLVFFDRS